ncbi:hypothetical protein CEP54_002990 [Fusarium duplospermum]|uniref:Transcription factor domain-containing protein n=1 Tax=Fusarium duplospermum TaxID=1325734 RepID=A0A428QRP2_9HYPO|nr:hypothetical protein CEP54_002990 [Fusarium duplospermum]
MQIVDLHAGEQCAANIPTLLDDLTTSNSKPSGPCLAIFSPMRFPSFPFEIDLDDRPTTKSQIIARYLPSKGITKELVRAYLDTIEGVNRLFHVPTLELELECYWLNPSSASYDWLAQLLTILALGTRITQERIGHRNSAYSIERYLRGASACLAQLSYPFHASLETVRTLCLMATAKKASLFSCHERDACGPLLDAALHMCLMLGLDQIHDANSTQQDWLRTFKENRVWTTVRYMYLHHSMHAGTSVLLLPPMMQPSTLMNANDVEIDSTWTPNDDTHNADEWTESSAELLISRSLPLVSAIISLANLSTATEPQSIDLIAGDLLIRGLLRETEEVFAGSDSTWKCLQRCMLVVYFRRVLLTIYHLASQSNTLVDTAGAAIFSPLAETECAISILVQQRCMLEDSGFSRLAGRVVAELYKEDFLIAALVIGGQWTRTTGFLSSLNATDTLPSPSEETETVIEGLHWCRELWGRDVKRSICNFAAHSVLGRLLDVLGA